jgi:hypothetical protein
MHIGLVLVHVVLLVISLGGWEGRVSLPIGDSSEKFQTGLTIGGSAFCTVSAFVFASLRPLLKDRTKAYTSVLVMYTQRLSLRRDLLRPQSLTSLHDHTAAWLGIGSALNIARKQRRIVNHTLITTMYLLCVFGLHNTVPALLTLVTRVGTAPATAVIIEMTPNSTSARFVYASSGYAHELQRILPALSPLTCTVNISHSWTEPVDYL